MIAWLRDLVGVWRDLGRIVDRGGYEHDEYEDINMVSKAGDALQPFNDAMRQREQERRKDAAA